MGSRKRFHSVKYLGRLGEFLTKTVEARLATYGYEQLSASHFEILTYLLRKAGSRNMSQIASAIERRKPTVTVLVGKLVQLGLVRKESSPEDGRETRIVLTKKGLAFRPVANRISSAILSLELWGLTPDESERLYPLLDRIYTHINRDKKF